MRPPWEERTLADLTALGCVFTVLAALGALAGIAGLWWWLS